MSERLGIIGIPERLEDVLGLCGDLKVEPIFLLESEASSPAPGLNTLILPEGPMGARAERIRSQALAGLWSDAGKGQGIQALAAALDLPHLPRLSGRQQAALPIAGATLFSSSELEHLREGNTWDLPIPAWVRAACADGDSSCMRLEHPNDLSLASAKLRKRKADGQIRIQPVVAGPVYRLLAFKTGASLRIAGLIEEEVTSSVYRVPLGMSMPVAGRATLMAEVRALAENVNHGLPKGWGYVEMEFVDSSEGLRMVDVQCPARLDPRLCEMLRRSQGIDLRRASMECALGRVPERTPSRDLGAAFTWLLTRSGIVTGIEGVEEARRLPGIVDVGIVAVEGDILSHVVDIPSRERGGYILAVGENAAEARARLDAARAMVWLKTSPALL